MSLKFISAIFILFMLLIGACSTSEQTSENSQIDLSYQEVPVPEELWSEEFPKPDVWAKYPGGQTILSRTIQFNTRIPEPARRDGYGGRAIITYIVDEEGRAVQVEAHMSPHDAITDMYKEVISNLEQWEPAIVNGNPIAQQYMIVSMFRDGNQEIE